MTIVFTPAIAANNDPSSSVVTPTKPSTEKAFKPYTISPISLSNLPDRSKLVNDHWQWMEGFAHEPQVAFQTPQRVLLHPLFAFGTAAVRGMKPLTANVTAYWEIKAHGLIFGTSVQFGVCNFNARTNLPSEFADIMGEDENSYGINQHGYAFHGGLSFPFCRPIVNMRDTVVGILFDGPSKSLSYFINGTYVGTPFANMNLSSVLYPMVSSTAQQSIYEIVTQKSIMHPKTLLSTTLLKLASNNRIDVGTLPIPKTLREQLVLHRRKSSYTARKVIHRTYMNAIYGPMLKAYHSG